MEASHEMGNGAATAHVQDELEQDALLAIRDPMTWLQDTTFWLISAGMSVEAETVHNVWKRLSQLAEDAQSKMVYDAVEQAALQEAGVA